MQDLLFHLPALYLKKAPSLYVFLICGDVQTMDHTMIMAVGMEHVRQQGVDCVQFHP